MSRNETITEHPAMGMLSIHRISGQKTLFGVDYPQGNYVVIEVHQGYHRREYCEDHYHSHGGHSKLRVALSEVQYARAISSMNTMGVPCTIERAWNPDTGKFEGFELPESFTGKKDTFKAELKGKITSGMDSLKSAAAKLKELQQPGVSAKKSDISTALGMVDSAIQQIERNMPFYIQQIDEGIERVVESAKGEISAYADFKLQEIGTRALGEKFAHLPPEQAIAALGKALVGHADDTVKIENKEN
jgi:hypothetical protein